MGAFIKTQPEVKDAKLLLFLVYSWTQEGVSAFQQKQFECLLQLGKKKIGGLACC
jgi:hypothetical protein